MDWWMWLAAGALTVVIIDRLLLAAEERGWIYWRRRTPGGSRAGTAFLGIQALLEPDKEHVVTELRREADHIEVAGDDEPLRPERPQQPAQLG